MTIFRGPGGTGSATSDSDTTEFQEFLVQSQAARDAALAAQVAAELAETNAETAETNAETAETNAETAATNAASSASAAASSASNASTSATNAASSASAASTSATNASASASAAAASASAALTSENNAETAETNAAASATAAAGSATTAGNSATTATNKATEAASSATAAAGSATTATTQATNAATSATAAASSASSAASSAASAAAALDSFDDRYLGSKTSDPTVDNDGNALVTGALYYRTTTPAGMKVYDGAQWLAASSAMQAALVTYEYVATAGQTTFSGNDANGVSLSYIAGGLIVSLNGAILRPGDDYTATNGTSIVLVTAASLNDELCAYAFNSFNVANTYTQAQVDAALAGKQNSLGYTPLNTVDPAYTGLLIGGIGVLQYLKVDPRNTTSGWAGITLANPYTGGEGVSYLDVTGRNDVPDSHIFFTHQVDNGSRISFATQGAGANTDRRVERVRIASTGQMSTTNGAGTLALAYDARVWVNFNGTGTVAIRASGNVSSITDNGVGDYTVNFATAMTDANYAILGTMGGQNVQTIGGAIATPNVVLSSGALSAPTTSSCRIVCAYNGADAPYVNVAIFR